jgi:hypothetical protein
VPVAPERASLLWQLRMTTSLLQIVTSALTDEEAFRPPAPGAWTVHQDEHGRWTADWPEEDLDPAPSATVAWLLWHIGWWWLDVSERAFGDGPVSRGDAPWPGSVRAALDRIDGCHQRWLAGVTEATTEQFGSIALGDRCWPLTGLPFAHVVAWVNGELMKNTAEIGATRRIVHGQRQEPEPNAGC